VKVAFLEDLGVQGSLHRVVPAFQGAKLAFDAAALAGDLPVDVELVGEDTGGDPARAEGIARDLAEDPGFVGVIGGPFLEEASSVGAILDGAGLPTVSLSTLSVGLSGKGWSTWFRAVANQVEQAGALAERIAGMPRARRGVCLIGDGRVGSSSLLRTMTPALKGKVSLKLTVPPENAGSPVVAAAVERAGCGVVFWGGLSTEAALLRLRLTDAGLEEAVLVGADGTKDQEYLDEAGPAGEGTIVSCPCVDLSTSTELPAQRFIQDYQSDFGSPPGVYAAEGWDVARMFVAAFRSGATDRSGVARWFRGLDRFEGLANTYAFRPDGELAPSAAVVRFYRDEGGRWIPLR